MIWWGWRGWMVGVDKSSRLCYICDMDLDVTSTAPIDPLELLTPADWMERLRVRRYLRQHRAPAGDLTQRTWDSTVKTQNRRARKMGLEGRVSLAQWELVLEMCDWKCLRCGEDSWLEMDHVVPLGRGGEHAARNLQALCRDCNNLKGAEPMELRPSWMLVYPWESR